MGVSISRDKIKFLENFERKSVSEQDYILLENSMEPIAEDTELKDFLDINGAYVSLIRELCDLIVRKKEDICMNICVELIELTTVVKVRTVYKN